MGDMIKPYCLLAEDERTSPIFAKAFSDGSGWEVGIDKNRINGPLAMFGSIQLKKPFLEVWEKGYPIYYGDHAYFGRFKYYRVTRIQKTRDGELPWPMQHVPKLPAVPSENQMFRFNIIFQEYKLMMEPRRKNGDHILLCPPDNVWAKYEGFDEDIWTSDIMAEIKRNTDRPIRLRPRQCRRPLSDDLRECWALVTHHSNVAVEAVLAGVPVFVTSNCASLTVGNTDLRTLDNPYFPDETEREQWAVSLCANQFTLDQIRSGLCWRHIGV